MRLAVAIATGPFVYGFPCPPAAGVSDCHSSRGRRASAAPRDKITLLSRSGRSEVAGADGDTQAGSCFLGRPAPMHLCTKLPTVVAGRAGGAIDAGRHLMSQRGTPIAMLWLTMAQTVGGKLDRVGDSTGPLSIA